MYQIILFICLYLLISSINLYRKGEWTQLLNLLLMSDSGRKISGKTFIIALLIAISLTKSESIKAHSRSRINFQLHSFLSSQQQISSLSKEPGLEIPLDSILMTNSARVRTFRESSLFSNMIVTDEYALIGQTNQGQPVLKKLDFTTMKIETIKHYPATWFGSYKSALADLKNGDIVHSESRQLYILDNETLKIKQEFSPQELGFEMVNKLFSFFDESTERAKILLLKEDAGRLSEFRKNSDGKYFLQDYFGKGAWSNLVMTGNNNGVMLSQSTCKIEKSTNLKSIVFQGFDTKYFLPYRTKVAISLQEDFFVAKSRTGYYEFYTMEHDYETILKSSLFINRNEHRKGELTSDDKTLFIALSNPSNEFNVAKVDVQTLNLTFVTDIDDRSNNLLDFTLFDAEHNRMVTLAIRNKNRFFLQLRTVDDLRLLNQIAVEFDFQVLDYKLLGSIEWGLSFALAVRNRRYSADLQNDAKLYLFGVLDDRITSMSAPAIDVSIGTLQAIDRYILTYKARFEFIRIFHFSNLSLVHEINAKVNKIDQIKVEKSMLILGNDERHQIYDLKESLLPKGWIYRARYRSEGIMSLILNKLGILLEINIWDDVMPITITKLAYNLSVPLVSQAAFIPSPDKCYRLTHQSSSNPSDQCKRFLYFQLDVTKNEYQQQLLSHPRLIQFSECSQDKNIYPINAFGDSTVDVKIQISSNKKFAHLIVCLEGSNKCLVEIRNLASLSTIIYHGIHEFETKYYFNSIQVNAEVTNDESLLLLQSPSVVYAIRLQTIKQLQKVEGEEEQEKKNKLEFKKK